VALPRKRRRTLYTRVRNGKWQRVDSVGLGERFFAQDDDMLATALVVDEELLHLSVSVPI